MVLNIVVIVDGPGFIRSSVLLKGEGWSDWLGSTSNTVTSLGMDWPCPEQILLSDSVFNLPCAKHIPSKQVVSAAIVANLLNKQMAMIFAFVMIASIEYLTCFTHRMKLYSQHYVDDMAT